MRAALIAKYPTLNWQQCTGSNALVPALLRFSISYEDKISDGFYEVVGDFPEVVDSSATFPSLAQLQLVQPFESDQREVRPATSASTNRHFRQASTASQQP